MSERRARIVNGKSFKERLLEEAARCRETAEQLPPSTERENLIKRGQQAETAAQMDDWLAASNQPAPASVRLRETVN
jgi:hypothetical protein